MATSKPRITVTLDDSVYQTLHALAALQGCSMSSIVSDLLLVVNPVQTQVLRSLQKVASLQGDLREGLVDDLKSAMVRAEASALPLFGVLSAIEAGGLPPHSNTGVTFPDTPPAEEATKPGNQRSRASERDSDA